MITPLIFALAAVSQPSQQQPTPDGPTIIVTGERIGDLRAALAACLARNCPPDEDINATLALAEGLFVQGDYVDAREQVGKSISRNGDEARRFPEPVSDLHRVHARLSRNLGHDRAALRSTHNILKALETGIPQQDHRHFTARFEVAEVQLRMGKLDSAKETLIDLAADAQRAGRQDVATQARLRTLWYEWLAMPEGDARSQLERLARLNDPDRRYESVGARLILARILRQEGKVERAEALLAGIGNGNSGVRRLLSAPNYQLVQQEIRGPTADGMVDVTANVLNRLTVNYDNKWIDVGFWIMPDGRVADVEVLRKGGPAGWSDPLLTSLAERRYTAAAEPTYKVERYTMTAELETTTGSRIARHSPRARVEYLDLTAQGEAGQPASQPPAAQN
jgi:hypothetical protein